MRAVAGVVLVLAGVSPLTFRTGAERALDRLHRHLYGRSATGRRRRAFVRGLDVLAVALAIAGVVLLALS